MDIARRLQFFLREELQMYWRTVLVNILVVSCWAYVGRVEETDYNDIEKVFLRQCERISRVKSLKMDYVAAWERNDVVSGAESDACPLIDSGYSEVAFEKEGVKFRFDITTYDARGNPDGESAGGPSDLNRIVPMTT